jgi:high-affinity iron transporter
MKLATATAITLIALGVAACGGSGKAATHAAGKAAGAGTTAARTVTPPGASGGSQTASAGSGSTGSITPVVAIELYRPIGLYTIHTNALVKQLQPQIARLQAAAAGGDIPAAEHDWLRAHATWLAMGQDDDAYGAFGQLGEDIDGLAAGLPGTTSNPHFTGFHKIEFELWRRHDAAAAATDSAQLARFVRKLTPETVAGDLPVSVTALDIWILRCHEILEDALRDTLSADDDYGSNSDLWSLAADVKATREMLTLLTPLIDQRAPKLVPTAKRDLATLTRAIDAAGGPSRAVPISALPTRQRQDLDAATSGALETLAPVSDLMYITNPGS